MTRAGDAKLEYAADDFDFWAPRASDAQRGLRAGSFRHPVRQAETLALRMIGQGMRGAARKQNDVADAEPLTLRAEQQPALARSDQMKKRLRIVFELQPPRGPPGRLAIHASVQSRLLENAGEYIVWRSGHGLQVSTAARDALTMSVSNKGLRTSSMGRIEPAMHPADMNNTALSETRLRLSSPAFVMTGILALFMLFLAFRGFFVPHAAAAAFGIPIADPTDLLYIRIKGDRDLATALALIGLMALRRPLPLAIFIAACVVQPLFDCFLVLTDSRGSAVQALSVHGSAAVYVVVVSLLLLREHGRSRSRAVSSVN
jgi:hypothetical protein